MDLPALHRAAREIFLEALHGVDAREAVRRAASLDGSHLKLVKTTVDLTNHPTGIYSVAIGKAARPMASALSEMLGERLAAGVIAAPTSDTSLSDRWRVFEGGHPLPNQASLDAARAAFDLLRRAESERAPVIFLISGGGSALMEWPREEGTTLEELRAINDALISCGANIVEINAVRRAISAVKGGGLERRAPNCAQISLIVSDTNAGEEKIVASGPTFDPPTDSSEAAAVIARYELEASLPASILRAIRHCSEKMVAPSHYPLREHYVLLDNECALASAAEAARSRGFAVEIAHDVVEQAIAEGCSLLLAQLLDLSRRASREHRGVCLISGGEFACPVRGSGVGGRNAESALRWAIELDARAGDSGFSHAVALSIGTDGVDGNSPAAGALCDETTIKRARRFNLDAHHFLDESNAYNFFQPLGDAIITSPTGTNVRDLRIMLACQEQT
ncbi:MAG: glycerate 2-kinase [Acidobacteriota bacterium]|jgi:hydroxypyruvate reductase|nr:glycerate 2-kinase [Acidobacteriota bacterium]